MAVCNSCGAQIEWMLTERGKCIPLDTEARSDGNLVVTGEGTVRALRKGEAAAGPRYRSHFASCPNAAQHRRKEAE